MTKRKPPSTRKVTPAQAYWLLAGLAFMFFILIYVALNLGRP